MRFLLVAIGGAVGASLRYRIDRTVQASHDTTFHGAPSPPTSPGR